MTDSLVFAGGVLLGAGAAFGMVLFGVRGWERRQDRKARSWPTP